MIRRKIEMAVAQDADGVWRQREISSVARFRVRVVSDRSRVKPHQLGSGEDFELVVDSNLEIWVRKFGTDAALRRDEDVAGVSLVVLENVTMGIPHEISYPVRPSSELVRWSCSCGAGSRGWLERDPAEKQADQHRRELIERDLAAEQLAQRKLAARRDTD